MSYLLPDGTSIYDHFNKSEPISVPVDMDALAEMVEASNYGTVRFLAALVRVRKRLFVERMVMYRDRGDNDIADSVGRRGDAIVIALMRLLDQHEF